MEGVGSGQVVRRLPCAHTFGSIATYFDTIDYAPEANFLQDARYDVFGYDVSTSSFLVIPMREVYANIVQIFETAHWS